MGPLVCAGDKEGCGSGQRDDPSSLNSLSGGRCRRKWVSRGGGGHGRCNGPGERGLKTQGHVVGGTVKCSVG